MKRSGVPRIRFYDTRHTAATLLLSGVHPKVVSGMLGHSGVTITLTVYAHVLPKIQRDGAALDRLLETDSEPPLRGPLGGPVDSSFARLPERLEGER